MIYDAIVVGAGPAGSTAALHLVRRGATVLLLDRQRFPRDKACGGGLTPHVRTLIDWDFGEVVEASATVTRTGMAGCGEHFETPSDAVLLVKRRRFDQHLVERAREEGAERLTFHDGVRIVHVAEDDDRVTVATAQGDRFTGRFLLGADGAAGACAAALDRRRRTPPGVALDADVEVPPAVFEREAIRNTFEFDWLPCGYGWTFPKDGYLSCGVGSWRAGTPLPKALDDYLAGTLPPGSVLSQVRRGHPIPIYDGPAPIGTRRACLIGDAASLIDPIMGEGIRFAIWSGQIAATLTAERLADEIPLDDGAEYGRRIHDAFGRDFDRQLRFIQPILFRDPRLFWRRFFTGQGNYQLLARELGERLDGDAAYPFGRSASSRSAQSR